MTTIEQAREVSARLHLGVSIANERGLDKDFAILAKAAGNTIDALIAELALITGTLESRDRNIEVLADENRRLSAELATLKGQEPVLWQSRSKPDWEQQWSQWSECSASAGLDMQKTPAVNDWRYEVRPLFLAAGARPAQEQQTLKADGIVGWRWVATCGSGTYQLRDDEPLRGYSYKAPVYESLPVQAPKQELPLLTKVADKLFGDIEIHTPTFSQEQSATHYWIHKEHCFQPPYDHSCKYGDEDCPMAAPVQAHTDHPLRHFDRTCPACNAQERKPLSDEQIRELRRALPYGGEDKPEPWAFEIGVRAAERHHGIKEQP